MLAALLFSLAASAGGPPLAVYEAAACPVAALAPSARAQLSLDEQRARCLMAKALEEEAKLMVPDDGGGPAFPLIYELREAFAAWVENACMLSGWLAAYDVTRDRKVETPEAIRAGSLCRQGAWGERGFLFGTFATFDPQGPAGRNRFLDVVIARQPAGVRVRAALTRLRVDLSQGRAARPTAALRTTLAQQIDVVRQGAASLAKGECGLRHEGATCVSRLENYYFSLVNPYPGGVAPGRGG
ncbi:MAG TPA: hypothetical protein VMB50_20325 [Myxococcales bacterium]|nr:hypothetical protein [Myxococcales bacterium]